MPDFDYPYDPAQFVPPPDWRSAWPKRKVLWAILVSIGLCFAVIDFSFCWVASYPFSSLFADLWRGFNIGGFGAQAGLLAIYAVFGPGRIWLRHVIALLLGSGSVLIWMLGYLLADSISDNSIFPYHGVREICAEMLAIPALFLAGCVPLWIPRTLFRWRLELQLPGHAVAKPPQLSIAGILAATSVVAVALTLVRLGAYASEESNEANWWLGTGIGAAFSAGICLFTLPVSIWGVLRTRYLAAGITLIAIWLGIVGIGLIALLSVLAGDSPPSDVWLIFAVFTASFIVFLLGPLVVCRYLDYRLLVGRQQSQEMGNLKSQTNGKDELGV